MIRMAAVLLGGILVLSGCHEPTAAKRDDRHVALENGRAARVSVPVKTEGVQGRVEVYEDNPAVYFVMNWRTRSRKSYEVVNAQEINLRQHAGRILTIKAEIIAEDAFPRTLRVIEILKIEDAAGEQ